MKGALSWDDEIQTSPVAIVTGASSGIGFLSCIELAKAGFKIVAVIRDRSKVNDLSNRFQEQRVDSFIDYWFADLTNFSDAEQIVRFTIGRYGRMDLLLNNAGFMVRGFVEETDMELWKRQFETNFFGMVALTRHAVEYMRKQKSGSIINMSSLFGRIALPAYGPYIASKYAVEGFSEALRLEMLPYGVYVSLIEPGPYRTNMWSHGIEEAVRNDDSPYAPFRGKIKSIGELMFSQAGNPLEVARLVVQIARTKTPKLRYQPGIRNRLLWKCYHALPRTIFEYIMKRTLAPNDK